MFVLLCPKIGFGEQIFPIGSRFPQRFGVGSEITDRTDETVSVPPDMAKVGSIEVADGEVVPNLLDVLLLDGGWVVGKGQEHFNVLHNLIVRQPNP